jgi:hypothetical protein
MIGAARTLGEIARVHGKAGRQAELAGGKQRDAFDARAPLWHASPRLALRLRLVLVLTICYILVDSACNHANYSGQGAAGADTEAAEGQRGLCARGCRHGVRALHSPRTRPVLNGARLANSVRRVVIADIPTVGEITALTRLSIA